MLIRVPFCYTARVVAKGHRKPQETDFWEWTDVELREVDPEDAPVAAEWKARPPEWLDGNTADRWGPSPSDGRMQTRWHGGAHWWPVLRDNERQVRDRLTPAAAEAMCAAGDWQSNPLMLWFGGIDASQPARPLDPDEWRSAEKSTRDRDLQLLRERAAQFFACDGHLWKRGAEPVTEIVARGGQGQIRAALLTAPVTQRERRDPLRTFRADRVAEAIREMKSQGGAWERAVFEEDAAPAVFLPESLAYADEEMALRRSAERLLRSRGDEPSINRFSLDMAVAWIGTRDALGAADELGQEGHERLAEALETLAASGWLSGETDRDAAARAVARWRERPIPVMDGNEAGAPKP